MPTAFNLTSFVAVMLASGGAASQESNARPEAAVVERWTYQAHDRQFDEGAFTIEVSEKTSTGYVLSSKDVTTKTLSLIPSGLTLDLNWLRAAADGPAANCKMSQMTVGAVVAYVVYRLVKRGERLGNLRSGYPDEIRGILARGPVKQSRVIEWLWTTSIKGKVSGRSISASLKWS